MTYFFTLQKIVKDVLLKVLVKIERSCIIEGLSYTSVSMFLRTRSHAYGLLGLHEGLKSETAEGQVVGGSKPSKICISYLIISVPVLVPVIDLH